MSAEMMNPSQRLDATFAALADPTRRAILTRLARGDASVAELAKPFAMSQPAISKHLKVLENAGLVSTAQDAQRRPRSIEGVRLGEATAWLEEYRQFWESRYSALDQLLGELQSQAGGPPTDPPRRPSKARQQKSPPRPRTRKRKEP